MRMSLAAKNFISDYGWKLQTLASKNAFGPFEKVLFAARAEKVIEQDALEILRFNKECSSGYLHYGPP
jgi:hypothetical protein